MSMRHRGRVWCFTRHARSRMAEMDVNEAQLRAAMDDPYPMPSKKYPGCVNYRSGDINLGTHEEDDGSITIITILWANKAAWQRYCDTHPEVTDREVKKEVWDK